MDIFPTLLELAGVPYKEEIDGRSFLNTLLGKPMEEKEREIYFTRREGGLNYGGKAYYALRKGDWKLLQNSPYQPMELYNLKEDPLEKKDLMKTEPGMVKELNQLLMKHIQEAGKTPWQKPDHGLK
jgi:arylsulfatase A-like enzyme